MAVVAPQRDGHPGVTQPGRVRLPLVPQRVAARGKGPRGRQAGQVGRPHQGGIRLLGLRGEAR